ncbi:MFS transporter [Acidiplasma aeolicum]|jgi:MFS family permease|uniref:MFS transporter n=1 Tax=Acidiplasma aeolicum TaxID=507754 RepID=UPI00371CCCA2
MLQNDFYQINYKNYIKYLISRNISRYSNLAYYIYFMWEIVDEYKSIFLVSLIPAFSFLGYIIISLPEGHIIDKYDRKKIFIISNILMVFVYLLLLINKSLFFIYAVDFLSSLLMWVISDDFRGITKEIIPENSMVKAQSLDQTSSGLFTLAGTLSGGFFIFLERRYFYLFLIVISVVAVIMILGNHPAKIYSNISISNGFNYTFKIIKSIIPFLLFTMLLNGLFVSLDVFSSALIYIILRAPPIYYTFFIAGFPMGMLIGGIIAMKKFTEKSGLLKLFVFGIGAIFIFIALNRIAILDSVLAVFLGIIIAFLNVYIETLIINSVPNSITGKFNSITTVFSGGSSPVMAVIFGILSEFIFFPYIIIITGLIMMASSFMVNRIFNGFKDRMDGMKIIYPELFRN